MFRQISNKGCSTSVESSYFFAKSLSGIVVEIFIAAKFVLQEQE